MRTQIRFSKFAESGDLRVKKNIHLKDRNAEENYKLPRKGKTGKIIALKKFSYPGLKVPEGFHKFFILCTTVGEIYLSQN